MNRPLTALVGLSAVALLATSTASFAAEPSKPPMHMHKSEMNHRSAKEAVFVEYKSEATQLREMAQAHHTLANQYRARTGGTGELRTDCGSLR